MLPKPVAKICRRTTHDDCDKCPARHIDLLSRTDSVDRDSLLEGFRIVSFAAKETVYHLGDPGEWLYLVRFGMIKLLRYSSGGAERIVGLARTGDTIGTAAVSRIPYRRTAVALTGTELCRVPGELVRAHSRTEPELLAALMTQFQADLDAADTFLTELSTGSAHARMAHLLLFLAEKHDHGEAPLPCREDIGALLGITTETASRVIAEFRRERLIEVHQNDRCHCNVEALSSIAGA
jgi:CRP/FNR family transcriptional regulator